jgi:hypothetical protein
MGWTPRVITKDRLKRVKVFEGEVENRAFTQISLT